MMNFLARNRRDYRLAHLAPFQHLQPGRAGVFHRGRSKVAPYEGVRMIGSFPGLKPRGAESSCPFGVENPLQKSLN
jgi:hypothetical protein